MGAVIRAARQEEQRDGPKYPATPSTVTVTSRNSGKRQARPFTLRTSLSYLFPAPAKVNGKTLGTATSQFMRYTFDLKRED